MSAIILKSLVPPKHAPHTDVSILGRTLAIDSIRYIKFGRQIRLACGLVINIYDTGTVLVQGKLQPQSSAAVLYLLKEILPQNTRWNL